MGFTKELQSDGNSGEQIFEENECENDSQHEQNTKTKTSVCSRNDDKGKDTKYNSERLKRTYSIDSGELGMLSPHSCDTADSIRSLSLRGALAPMLGEADTIEGTLCESLCSIKETKSLEDSSSIDTNEDDYLNGKTVRSMDARPLSGDKKKKRKKRISEMNQNEQLRSNSSARRKERKTKASGAITPANDCESGNDAIAAIAVVRSVDSGDDAMATIDDVTATPAAGSNIKKSKKKKNKKGSNEGSKRKGRRKPSKNNSSHSSGGGWWRLANDNSKDDTENSVAGAGAGAAVRKRKIRKDTVVEGSQSMRSSIVEEDDDIKDSCHVRIAGMNEIAYTTEKRQDHIAQVEQEQDDNSIVSISDLEKASNDINGDKKKSGYGGAIGLNEMIADAAKKRQERVASNTSLKLLFQSPVAHKGSLSSRLQNKQHFPAPLSPPTECNDNHDAMTAGLEISANENDQINEGNKNSGYGGAIGLNEMIAAAVKEREERIISSNSLKLPFQSPSAHKQSLSSRLNQKGFPAPLSPQTTEHDATSSVAAFEISPSTNNNDNEAQDNSYHDEMTIAEMAAAAANRIKRVKENKINAEAEAEKAKVKHFRKFVPIAVNQDQRKDDKENHRTRFVPVAGEAATFGRLVRLEEKVVEAQGGVNHHHPNDIFNTWSGPKLRTDDRRSNALRAIQDAAAMGRMKSLAPEIVKNHEENGSFYGRGSDNNNDTYFDIENQTDENGEKILRTNFLLDRHVKEILQGKKKRMFTCSDAIGDRDDKIASYKDFDDVKLPTDTLPTFDRIVGRRLNKKSFSSCADLAVLAMHMSEGNLKANMEKEEEDDIPKITAKRLRVLESISTAVAASAWARDTRLQRSNAVLKVTRKCMCPYCKDPTPYQTHKYKRLMNPDKFNEKLDQNDYCQEVVETIGTVSDAAKANNNSYTISPGGRKKKIIRIVKRRRKRPKGVDQITAMSSTDKNRVINGTTLSPEELDSLTKQLQTQGAKGMTTDLLVLIANELRIKASNIVNATPIKKEEETSNLSHQVSSSPSQQESIANLSTEKLLQTAADLNAPVMTTEEMLELENKLFVSSPHHEEQKSTDMIADRALQVANDLTAEEYQPSDLLTASSTQEDDRESSLIFPANLPFLDSICDNSSVPISLTQEVTVHTTAKILPPETSPRATRKRVPTKRRSVKAQNKDKIKSPSARKPKKSVSLPPVLSGAKKISRGADLSNGNYVSPQSKQKKKAVRRRPKETIQSPSQNNRSTLPASPSLNRGRLPKETMQSPSQNNRSTLPASPSLNRGRLPKETMQSPSQNNRSTLPPRPIINEGRLPKETMQSPPQNKTSNLPAPPSKSEDMPRKKSLRSRLKNLTRSTSPRPRHESRSISEHESQDNKVISPKSDRRGGRRSHSMHAERFQDEKDIIPKPASRSGKSSLSISGSRPQEACITTEDTFGRMRSPKSPKRTTSLLQNNYRTVEKTGRRAGRSKELTETLLPRSQKRNIMKPDTSSSSRNSEHALKKPWIPEIRSPTRTRSLPIQQKQKTPRNISQRTNNPKKNKSLPLEKAKFLTRISTLENGRSRVVPSRTLSFQKKLEHPNDHVDTPILNRLPSQTNKGEQKDDEQSLDRPPSGSPKQPFQSPRTQKRNLSSRIPKNPNIPEPPSQKIEVDNSPSKPIPPIPLVITISHEVQEECTDSNSNSTDPTTAETPENSQSSHLIHQQQELVNKQQRSKSLNRNSSDRLGVIKSPGQGRTKPKRRAKKTPVVGQEQEDRDNNGKESHPDPSKVFPGRVPHGPRRCRSLDRLSVIKLGGRGKDNKKDGSEDKKRKNLKSRNWLKRGS